MLAYLAILGAALSGLAGGPVWTIAVSAIALMSLSYAEHFHIYRRGQEMGVTDVLEWAIVRSALHAVLAAGAAFLGGFLLRLTNI